MVKNPAIEIEFLIYPRDFFVKKISLAPKTMVALNNAAKILKEISNGRYKLVVTRGYIYWGRWRRFRGRLAKLFFCLCYWSDRKSAESLFGHNGHNDGLSVDVSLYDAALNKNIYWLSWRNIFISQAKAQRIIKTNETVINLLDTAMKSVNFNSHSDPREKLQMHYRLNEPVENTALITVSQNITKAC